MAMATSRHGYPRGYRFAPKDEEVLALLDYRLNGRPLPHPLPNIFHELRILAYHPDQLYEMYKEYEENGSIYFFSARKCTSAASGRRKKTLRMTESNGVWKASGGSTTMGRGGVAVGRIISMVYYQHFHGGREPFKSDWSLKEYTKIGPDGKDADIAVYRLYETKNGSKKMKKKNTEKCLHLPASSSSGADKPSSSTVQALPPPPWGLAGAVAPTFMPGAVASASSQAPQPVLQYHNHYASNVGFMACSPATSTAAPPYLGWNGEPPPLAAAADEFGEWYDQQQQKKQKQLLPSSSSSSSSAPAAVADEFSEWYDQQQLPSSSSPSSATAAAAAEDVDEFEKLMWGGEFPSGIDASYLQQLLLPPRRTSSTRSCMTPSGFDAFYSHHFLGKPADETTAAPSTMVDDGDGDTAYGR